MSDTTNTPIIPDSVEKSLKGSSPSLKLTESVFK